jgi:beta-mannosidase
MKTIYLNGQWKLRNLSENDWVAAQVPGTVFGALLDAGKAPDPYYRDNEDKVAALFNEDYEYRREFTVNADVLRHDRVQLTCEGLDTLSQIRINGNKLADTDNMHRTYSFDVKELLRVGENTIEIIFSSPVKFVGQKIPESIGLIKGIDFIRKVQCSFGWDWGLSLPDSGIWRDIYMECFDAGSLKDVQVLQDHKANQVVLNIKANLDVWGTKDLELVALVTSPNGEKFSVSQTIEPGTDICSVSVTIPNPQLWWPNGFGSQPLYQVQVFLKDGAQVCDAKEMHVGLRTITLRREKDEWGRSYEFVVNGRPIFMRGSNVIIQDAILGRYSEEKTEQLIKNCVQANFNCIRIWGGAHYPDDYFYDLCDKYGMVLYHDLMFACNFYPADDAFIANISQEIIDNVKRARNHACIGLWSGNNEIEGLIEICFSQAPERVEFRKLVGLSEMDANHEEKATENYKKLFYGVIPELIKELDPQTSYVSSSPSGEATESENLNVAENNNGDSHYYPSYDMLAPYEKIRTMNFRFISEMGFQSYPSIKTIRSFTLPEDRSPYTDVMLKHQKAKNGNQIIEAYMSKDYKVPADFEKYVYVSQMLAGEVLKYAVEHLRRNEGRSMGFISWQLNDCWPVVSWAGVDYFGRWKAQQYYTKRFYSPVLISALDQDTEIDLWVINDTPADIQGTVQWKLLNARSQVVRQGSKEISAVTCKSQNAVHLDFSDFITEANRGGHYVEFEFAEGGSVLSSGTALFVKPKDFQFEEPGITLEVWEDSNRFYMQARSKAFAKGIALDLSEADCIFSDNYFDLSAGVNKIIEVEKSSLSEELSLEQFRQQLTVTNVYDLQ